MSCDSRRKKLWKSLGMSQVEQDRVEQIYRTTSQAHRQSRLGVTAEQKAKALRLFALFRQHQVPPPVHGKTALPRNPGAVAGYAAIWDWLQTTHANLKQLQSGTYQQRYQAADALASSLDPAAIPALIQALGGDDPADEESRVNRHAASALAEYGNQAISQIAVALKDPTAKPWQKHWAAETLGMIGGEQALDILVATLPQAEPHLAEGIVSALARIGGARASTALQEKAASLLASASMQL